MHIRLDLALKKSNAKPVYINIPKHNWQLKIFSVKLLTSSHFKYLGKSVVASRDIFEGMTFAPPKPPP